MRVENLANDPGFEEDTCSVLSEVPPPPTPGWFFLHGLRCIILECKVYIVYCTSIYSVHCIPVYILYHNTNCKMFSARYAILIYFSFLSKFYIRTTPCRYRQCRRVRLSSTTSSARSLLHLTSNSSQRNRTWHSTRSQHRYFIDHVLHHAFCHVSQLVTVFFHVLHYVFCHVSQHVFCGLKFRGTTTSHFVCSEEILGK